MWRECTCHRAQVDVEEKPLGMGFSFHHEGQLRLSGFMSGIVPTSNLPGSIPFITYVQEAVAKLIHSILCFLLCS